MKPQLIQYYENGKQLKQFIEVKKTKPEDNVHHDPPLGTNAPDTKMKRYIGRIGSRMGEFIPIFAMAIHDSHSKLLIWLKTITVWGRAKWNFWVKLGVKQDLKQAFWAVSEPVLKAPEKKTEKHISRTLDDAMLECTFLLIYVITSAIL